MVAYIPPHFVIIVYVLPVCGVCCLSLLYVSTAAPGILPQIHSFFIQAIQILRYEKALKEYVLARGHASSDELQASASKNIGSVHWRLSMLHAPGKPQLSSREGRKKRNIDRWGRGGRCLTCVAQK